MTRREIVAVAAAVVVSAGVAFVVTKVITGQWL